MTEKRQQRATLLLKDVCYLIEAHFEMTDKAGETDDEKKHYNIALRRMREGQFHHQPVFGNREFDAHFELLDNPEKSSLSGETDLGYMLYDLKFKKSKEKHIHYNDAEPIFYRPKMINGVIDVAKYFKEQIKI